MGRIRAVAPSHKFYLEIQGVTVGEFLECGGLSMEREVIDLPEGGVNDFVHRKPGKVTYSNITLKRGMTYDRDLLDWCMQGRFDGRVERKNVSVVISTVDSPDLIRWDFYDVFPLKWSFADMDAATMQVAWESIEFNHSAPPASEGASGDSGNDTEKKEKEKEIDLPELAERIVRLMRREAVIDGERAARF